MKAWLLLWAMVSWSWPSATAATGPELLHDGNFTLAAGNQPPASWQIVQTEWPLARMGLHANREGLAYPSTNQPFAVGFVSQTVSNIQAGRFHLIRARCKLKSVPDPAATVQVRIDWLRRGEPAHPAGQLARISFPSPDEAVFEDVFEAPEKADGARVTLETKWPRGGTVVWQEASLRQTDPPPARKVKVGTVYLRPRESTPERNLDLWCEQIDAAGKLGLDVVCLAEAILMVGTKASAIDTAESIPGPSTRRLGEAARRHHMWVVAGLMERDGERLYNTAVLLDRNGELKGKYRKTHLPREEWKKGIEPGSDYPVFQTDFGAVSIQICYDYFFPEPAQIFALRGAEILFAPTWGTTFVDAEGRVEGQTIFRVRARDNGLYLVPSVYDGDSMVIDPMGRVLASSRGQTGVFWAEIDLSRREPLWWVGHWRSIGPRDRRPDSYRPLIEPFVRY